MTSSFNTIECNRISEKSSLSIPGDEAKTPKNYDFSSKIGECGLKIRWGSFFPLTLFEHGPWQIAQKRRGSVPLLHRGRLVFSLKFVSNTQGHPFLMSQWPHNNYPCRKSEPRFDMICMITRIIKNTTIFSIL